eukprot:270071-Chlamydomonas_euryale.AAC.1
MRGGGRSRVGVSGVGNVGRGVRYPSCQPCHRYNTSTAHPLSLASSRTPPPPSSSPQPPVQLSTHREPHTSVRAPGKIPSFVRTWSNPALRTHLVESGDQLRAGRATINPAARERRDATPKLA